MIRAATLAFFLAVALCRADDAYTDALAAYKTGHYSEAEALCQKAIDALPPGAGTERERFLVLQGRAFTGGKDFDNAKAALAEVVRLDPANVVAQRALGDLHFHTRDYAKARVAYLDAQHYLPGKSDPDLTLHLTYCAIGQKDIGEALRLETTLNAFDDKTPAAYFAQAALARAKGDEATANQTLQTAATLYGPQVYAEQMRDYLFLFATAP